MTTYTWTTAGDSTSGALLPGGLPALGFTVPPGSTLRRFMLRGSSFLGRISGNDYRYMTPWQWSHTVTVYLPPDYTPKPIYTSIRSIPTEFSQLYDFETSERIYTQLYTAGDNELAFDQSTGYGRADATEPLYLTYEGGTFGGTSFGDSLGTVQGLLTYQFAMLYGTPDP